MSKKKIKILSTTSIKRQQLDLLVAQVQVMNYFVLAVYWDRINWFRQALPIGVRLHFLTAPGGLI
ncbi:hypothetical protein EMIT0P260_10278 [Pseudomonas sp. IT-P260]